MLHARLSIKNASKTGVGCQFLKKLAYIPPLLKNERKWLSSVNKQKKRPLDVNKNKQKTFSLQQKFRFLCQHYFSSLFNSQL
jgi:hypothetical protein